MLIVYTVKSRYKKPPRDHQEVSYNAIYFPVQIVVGPGPCCLYREVSYIGGFLYRDFTVALDCQAVATHLGLPLLQGNPLVSERRRQVAEYLGVPLL